MRYGTGGVRRGISRRRVPMRDRFRFRRASPPLSLLQSERRRARAQIRGERERLIGPAALGGTQPQRLVDPALLVFLGGLVEKEVAGRGAEHARRSALRDGRLEHGHKLQRRRGSIGVHLAKLSKRHTNALDANVRWTTARSAR